ncbi:MAG: methionyl-tRNA formyltransferase [Planctomycetes bacterium]|nr:methionyl-tRNA formyltransferase [Planctomycetota bacterium]
MRIVLWADASGVRSSLRACGRGDLIAVVVAANRVEQIPCIREQLGAPSLPVLVHPFRRDTAATDAFERVLGDLNADVFLVNSYSLILPERWLGIPSVDAINVHGGLLPEFRGANVVNWALISGASETGVTIHRLDAGVDTGPILMRRAVPIAHEDTAVTLSAKLVDLIGEMLPELLAGLEAGTIVAEPQDERRARHWPRRCPDDGEIDWTQPAERIYDLVRSLVSPWPGAFYYNDDGRKMVLDSLVPLPEIRALRDRILSGHGAQDRRHPSA